MYRDDIINYFIEKNNFERYLEIGVFDGGNIRKIKCKHKDGVDPGVEGVIDDNVTFAITSNEFFDKIAPTIEKYDIVFIDGLHHSEQVDLDIENALKYTNDNGIIILHDCNPPTLGHALVPRQQLAWNGDVYKSILKFQKNNTQHTYYTVDADWGIGVIVKNKLQENTVSAEKYDLGISNWDFFNKNRSELLNLIPSEQFYVKNDDDKNSSERPILEVFTTTHQEKDVVEDLIKFYNKRIPNCVITIQDNLSTDGTKEMCQKYQNVKFTTFDTGGKMSENKLIELRNNSWKNSNAKFIIVCDSDELVDVFEEDLVECEKLNLWTVCKCNGVELFDYKPFEDGEFYGVQSNGYSKTVLFFKDAIKTMNFQAGSHGCSPQPNSGYIVKYSEKHYNLYHTKWQNFDYGIERQNYIKNRGQSSDTPKGWNFHYSLPDSEHEKYFKNGYNNRIKIESRWSN